MQKDLETVVTVLSETLKISQENRTLLEQFITTFMTLEKSCKVMYNFITEEKKRADALEVRLKDLEKKLDQ